MNVHIQATPELANETATDLLARWLAQSDVRTVMVAAGNTPIELYRRIGLRKLSPSHLTVFALDEYVGVPLDEPRNCANLLRRSVAEAWGLPANQFFTISSLEDQALASVRDHESRIAQAGGLDVIVLGLGQNGHLGFNEPGSAPDSTARLLDLDPISVEANRKWFHGDYAPVKGVTVGLRTILSARRVLLLAFGTHKRTAVKAMIEGPVTRDCPASFLQTHPCTHVFLDAAAASELSNRS
jgi:glucosamine-6-phosphate deaminase